MKDKKLPMVLGILAFFLALLITLYPIISNYVNEKYASEIHTAYEEIIQQADNSDLLEAKKQAIAYNETITPGTAGEAYSQAALMDASEDYESLLNIAGNGTMGYDKLSEYSNLDELNYLASKLDDMMQYDYDKFCAAVYMGDHTSSIQDLINLTENLDCYDVYPDIEDDEDLGRYYLEEVDASLVPEHLRNYIDYEAYGRDIRFSDGGEYTDFGYVRDTGSSFVEFYNGDRDDIPEEYRIMNFETELPDEKRSEWAKDLAFDLDEFFRQQDPVYAAENPDEEAAKQALQDQLFTGRISAIDERLAALGQAANDYLPTRVANYKELIGYEEFLDIDTDALRQAIQNPDPSRVEDMLSFAVKAEQEYAAEAEAYVQTPADIIRQAQALQDQPDDYLTGESVQTPRGSFHLTSLSKEQMEAAGYGVHHNSNDGRYHIMGNGTRAFAVVKDTAHYCDRIGFTEVPQFLNPQQAQEKDNPLRTAEMTIEDDYGMIDGVINNGRRDEPLGKTSIRDRLEAAKKEIAQQKHPEEKRPGRDAPELGDL